MKKIMITISCLLMSLVLFACSSKNANNATVEMRAQDGYIQYNNGTGWANLISTEELKGEKGDKGDKGDPGTDGKNGVNGLNGKDGVDGVNGTNGANGKDGKDGADGKDAIITQDNITKEFRIRTGTEDGFGLYEAFYYYGGITINSLTKATVSEKTTTSFDKTNITKCTLLMNEDGKVEIEAKAPEGWHFVEWNDGSTEPKRTITYNDDANIVAYFNYDNEPLTPIYDLKFEVDYATKDFTISWDKVENAKDYTIYIDDKLTLTSNTNSITIPASNLEKDSEYDVAVIANPAEPSKYSISSYCNKETEYYGKYEVSVIPNFEKEVTTLDEYEKALEEAGFNGILSFNFVKDGATEGNDGKILDVSPTPGSKCKINKTVTITTYQTLKLYKVIDDGKILVAANMEDVTWKVEGASDYKIEDGVIYITAVSGENIKIVATASNSSTKEININVDQEYKK